MQGRDERLLLNSIRSKLFRLGNAPIHEIIEHQTDVIKQLFISGNLFTLLMLLNHPLGCSAFIPFLISLTRLDGCVAERESRIPP